MKNSLFVAGLWAVMACSGCHLQNQQASPAVAAIGKIEIYDTSAANIIDSNAAIEVIGKNYKWCEGPVWVASRQMLLFSDVLANRIYSWNMKDTPVLYLTPSGYTDTATRNGENGSNGLTLDNNGRLLLCQSGNRQVVRLNAP